VNGRHRLTGIRRMLVAGALLVPAGAAAQHDVPVQPPLGDPPVPVAMAVFPTDSPPPPVPPAVISRDGTGRVTVRAVRVNVPVRVDGQLDEELYSKVLPMSDFIQSEPREGAPVSQRTEVWLLYDDDHIYVSFRCWEDQPERMVVNDMRRDGNQGQNDSVGFSFDTFHDRRNAVTFTLNPIGGRTDAQVTNEVQWNPDWNPIWNFEVGRFEGGWSVETAVPFKSLRYGPGRAQIWGFNARRNIRWRNEMAFLTRVPIVHAANGLMRASFAATMVGLEAPVGSKNLEIKPYAVSSLTTDNSPAARLSNEMDGDVGVDVKYGITRSLTADFTVNTDFAQVEADDQQVNLTRFSLFFPEKREFFLENQGTFAFGGVSGVGGGSETPMLFYSRRIGLHDGRQVPIRAGGRLTGRVNRFTVGLLDIQTGDERVSGAQATNFSVMRLKRDVLRKSAIGALFIRRSVGQSASRPNETYGLDSTFAFFDDLIINSYWARTRTPGLERNDTSYRTHFDYAGDRYGLQVEHLLVGDHFNPEVGFVRRNDMRRSFGQLRFSPRSRAIKSVRKFSWTGSLAYIENGAGQLENRDWDGEFMIEFQNSDRFSMSLADSYELLVRPFTIISGVTVPAGGYATTSGRVAFNMGQHRRTFFNLAAEHGTFYSGRKTALSASRGRIKITPQVSMEPSVSITWVDLLEGAFTTKLLQSRVTYTMTPRTFFSALLQYNSSNSAMTSNLRLRWEYRPGSELFVTYNEERDTLVRRFPGLDNRTLIVKITRLFRF
jgi:hypothetical protein